MSHKVLNTFKEKEHDNTVYKAGELYPKEGFKSTKKRVEFLQKKHLEYGVAFLADEPEVEALEEAQDKEPVKKPNAKKKKSDAK